MSVARVGRATDKSAAYALCKLVKFTIENPLTLFSEDKAGAMATSQLVGNIGQLIAGKFKVFLDYNHTRIILNRIQLSPNRWTA